MRPINYSVDFKGSFLRSGGHLSVGGDVYFQLLLRDFIESGSNPLIRMDALRSVGGFDTSLTNAHDWDMWLRLAQRFDFIAVPKVQILYRVSINSMSTNILGMEVSSLKVIKKHYDLCCGLQQPPIEKILAMRYRYLTFKAIDEALSIKNLLISLRFFILAVKYDASWVLHKKIMLILVLKIILITLLPTKQAKGLLKFFKKCCRLFPVV